MNPIKSFAQYLLGESTVDNTARNAATSAAAAQESKIRGAIAKNETGIVPAAKQYSSSQNSGVKAFGSALGKYRVTAAELAAYAPHYIGKPVTPEQFLKDPVLQDQYMNGKISHYLSAGYTPEQFADIHNKGIQHEGAPGTTAYQNPGYVAKFDATYNQPNPS